MASSSVRMKLLIDTKARKVLFAEVGREFVDFLLYLLSLPLGTVVKLLREKTTVGSFSDLYGSIENLNESYFQKKGSKESVLNFLSPLNGVIENPLLFSHQSTTRKFYTCINYYCRDHYYVTNVENLACLSCKSKMTKLCSYVSETVPKGGGLVKGEFSYMIKDNLEVMPMSTISSITSSITLFNEFNVKDVSGLEEKIVVVGVSEGLKMLEASLECRTVLTKVFLVN